ncbi:MAG: 50S ribosomal protein L6 [Alphaproteobacteria bacterium]
MMSRIGKTEVIIPSEVAFSQNDRILSFKGKLGEEVYEIPSCLSIKKTDKGFVFTQLDDSIETRSLWGTTQRNITNIVKGVDVGFQLDVELVGVGYRASVKENKLVLQLGYSHDIEYTIPKGVTIVCEKQTLIRIHGVLKQRVSQVAAELKRFRKAEPYKGKGVRLKGEFVVRKEGKKKS